MKSRSAIPAAIAASLMAGYSGMYSDFQAREEYRRSHRPEPKIELVHSESKRAKRRNRKRGNP